MISNPIAFNLYEHEIKIYCLLHREWNYEDKWVLKTIIKKCSKKILVNQTRRTPVSQNCLNMRVRQNIIYKYPYIVTKKNIPICIFAIMT